ncbi:myo-inositol-1-phosphate synthase [Strigomonas culicis]|uniref:Myo-inositol-1-phosphate synthase n=1 Tax=Strigomonas culicis TaxID=28005 RepID=S9UQP5_9TRYP|nr:myo-inositol-1-phosphate synthase [Strigomonas culicis]|eukprot:EPY31188.1 myo-inositol-1-phosphate synthase [Strigomonas culicis]
MWSKTKKKRMRGNSTARGQSNCRKQNETLLGSGGESVAQSKKEKKKKKKKKEEKKSCLELEFIHIYTLQGAARALLQRGTLVLRAEEGHAALQQHVVLRRQTHQRTQHVLDGLLLAVEGVDDGGALRHLRRLQQVGQQGEDGLHVLVRLLRALLRGDGHTLHQLRQDDEVDDEGGREQRVLAGVVQHDGLLAAHEDGEGVLVQSALAVADVRQVLDDDAVVRLGRALGEEDLVRGDHVVHDVALGDLLRAELARGGQVVPVVVAEMVVAGNALRLDAGADEELDERRLHLGLAALEVVTADEDLVVVRQLDETAAQRVLRGAVDVAAALQHRGERVQQRRGELRLVALDGGNEVVGRVVDAHLVLAEALRVGGPEHNHLVELVGRLEVADVRAYLLHGLPLARRADDVVRALLLVARDEVEVEERGQGHQGLHAVVQRVLQLHVEDAGAAHGITQVHAAAVPAAHHEVVGVHHGHDGVQRDVGLLHVAGHTQVDSAGLRDGTKVVGLLHAALRAPGDTKLVGENASGQRAAVVAAPADEHGAHTRHLAVRAERKAGVDGLDLDRAVAGPVHARVVVDVLGLDRAIGVLDLVALHTNRGHVGKEGGGGDRRRIENKNDSSKPFRGRRREWNGEEPS